MKIKKDPEQRKIERILARVNKSLKKDTFAIDVSRKAGRY